MKDDASLSKNLTSQISEQIPTLAQLERSLGQVTQSLYRHWTGQRPKKTLCSINAKTVTLVIQGSITPAEKLLGQGEASQFRRAINEKIKPLVLKVVQEITGVDPEIVMVDSNFDTAHTGILVLLEDEPIVRSKKRSTTKIDKS